MVAQSRGCRSRSDIIRRWVLLASTVNEYFLAGLLILTFTVVAWLIEPFTGYQAVALLYLLLVVLL